jgi:hypothetical protein
MNTLTPDDLRYIVGMMPAILRSQIKAHKLMLAGGAIRSLILREKVNDWDLFGASAEQLAAATESLEATYAHRTRTIRSKNAYTITAAGRTPIQLITRWTYSAPEDLWRDFDFTIARAVIWCEDDKWKSATDPDYYADLAARRLRYRSPTRLEDAGGSMMRVLKFLRAGYIIAPEQLALVMARITGRIRWDHNMVTRDGGARVITALLREVDPLHIIDGLEVADTDPPEDEGIRDALIPQEPTL